VSLDESCAICGRTILAGERTHSFVSPREGPRRVCDLCRDRARALGWVDPAAPGANVGRRRDPDGGSSSTGRLERAVDRFNGSRAARTVAGLSRTLGGPWASVGAAAGSPNEVRVTVAWELCWYQWGVDVGDEVRPVFEIDRGEELAQLDSAARQWNATVDPEGALALGSAAARSARDGEPVG
jgi:hypothetical protein